MNTQVLLSMRDKVPVYDLSKRVFPLVYYLCPALRWFRLLKCSPWSFERMLRERYFIKLATRELIMKQALSPILQSDHKLVASPNAEFLFSDVFQACCNHREALTWECQLPEKGLAQPRLHIDRSSPQTHLPIISLYSRLTDGDDIHALDSVHNLSSVRKVV